MDGGVMTPEVCPFRSMSTWIPSLLMLNAASADDEEKREDVDDLGNIWSIDNLGSNSDSCKRNEGNTVKRIRML